MIHVHVCPRTLHSPLIRNYLFYPVQFTIRRLIETKRQKCLVVENPAVFTALIANEKIKDFSIVCTYGQVKLAGILLLDHLVKSGTTLYYSGDIDPEGMLIADKLKSRFMENINFIGFDRKTYENNKSTVKISDIRMKKLELLKDEDLKELGKLVQQEGVAAYEEKNIEGIIERIYKYMS